METDIKLRLECLWLELLKPTLLLKNRAYNGVDGYTALFKAYTDLLGDGGGVPTDAIKYRLVDKVSRIRTCIDNN